MYEIIYYNQKNKSMKVSQSMSNILRTLAFMVGVPVLTYLQEQIPGWDIDQIYKIAISSAIMFILKVLIPPISEPPVVTTTSKTAAGGPKPKYY